MRRPWRLASRVRFFLCMLVGSSEASERFDAVQIEAGKPPGEAGPAESGDGCPAYEGREEPEAGAASGPNVGGAEHAASDGSRIDGERRCQRLNRYGLRRRRSRGLQSTWLPSLRSERWLLSALRSEWRLRSEGRHKGHACNSPPLMVGWLS